MVDNLMLNNFLSRNNLYDWIFKLYKKEQFTYLFMIFGIVNDGDPTSSSKNPIKKYWTWKEDGSDLNTLYDKVNEFQKEAKAQNKEFFSIMVEPDEEENYRIRLVTKELISVAAERDRYNIAKDGQPIHPVDVPEKFTMPLECRACKE